VVAHLLATTTHHTLLFFTDRGRVFRVKAYEAPEAARDGRGMHVANMLSLPSDESVSQVLAIEDYEQMPYLVLTTRAGLVKKTRLTAYDTRLSGGIKAVALAGDDTLIGAHLLTAEDDLLMVSRQGMAIRFHADDATLRPMGRDTRGVQGMRFRRGDQLLASSVVQADLDEDDTYVFTVTGAGYAKRTPVSEYRTQHRAGLGLKAVRLSEARGELAGALTVGEHDEVLSIRASGGVTRSPVADVRATGRDTMGVTFVDVPPDDVVVALSRVVDNDLDAHDDTHDDAEVGTAGDVGEDA
jgi:DNA gyrase subunit A